MLKIKSVSKIYAGEKRNIDAVKNITFNAKTGEFVCLVGPSGSGKTTLLKCIAGLLEPTGGSVILDNKKITGSDGTIGMIFQEFSLFPWLTVSENIAFGLNIKGTPIAESSKIVEHYLNATGLVDFADAFPKSLSGGMKQRVAIARTLANNPQVILMDEPFGYLDDLTKATMEEFLTGLLEKEKKTIIFVTHDIEEALFLADKIYVLSSRPAIIKTVFNIPFKRPRHGSLKYTKEFFEFKNRVLNTLKT